MTSKPLVIEVIAYAPTGFYHCQHCEIVWKEVGFGQTAHQEQMESGIPADLMQDYLKLSNWVNALVDRYGAGVAIKVIDAASIEGFWKSLRYNVHRYPAVVVDGRAKHIGSDFSPLEPVIARALAQPV